MCDWRRRVNREAMDARLIQYTGAEFAERATEVTDRVRQELDGYFAGLCREFSIPLFMAGTPFQMKVWEALREVQYGHTETYLQLARRIHQPGAVRAVAAANAANPLAILVPCHRIVGNGGTLTGYSGGIEAKRILLALERNHEKGRRLF